MSDTITLYGYIGCGTCKTTMRTLADAGVAYRWVDLKSDTPGDALLRDLWRRAGVPVGRFFNTSGKSYRDGQLGERLKTMSDDEAIAALAADGMLIKRPLLDVGGAVLVGQKPIADWAAARSAGQA